MASYKKQALHLMLLLAVCAILLFQINHTRDKRQSFGCQIKLFEEYGIVLLGRKATPSWLINQIALPNLENAHFAAEEAEYTTTTTEEEDSRKIHSEESRSESEYYPNMVISEELNDVKIIKEKAKLQLDGSKLEDGVYSFHDENGVPPEGNIQSFTVNELGEIINW